MFKDDLGLATECSHSFLPLLLASDLAFPSLVLAAAARTPPSLHPPPPATNKSASEEQGRIHKWSILLKDACTLPPSDK